MNKKPVAIFNNGRLVFPGQGPTDAEYVFILDHPGETEQNLKVSFCGPPAKVLFNALQSIGFNTEKSYFTYAIKYPFPKGKKASSSDVKDSRPILLDEINKINPKVIVCLGDKAFQTLIGPKYSFSSVRGELIKIDSLPATVLVTYSPARMAHVASDLELFIKDLSLLVKLQNNITIEQDDVQFSVLTTHNEVKSFVDQIINNTQTNKYILSLDCEWHGKNWMDPNRYIRTIQFGLEVGRAVVVRITGENNTYTIDNINEVFKLLKTLLEHPKVDIVGHNVISDGQWLLSFGIDIRKKVVWDTMLCESLINEEGPFGLDELALKYTNYRRYSLPLETWVKENKELCEDGYGPVPDEILMPYAAKDVDVVLRILNKQINLLPEHVYKKRGFNQQYLSLFETILRTQEILYELENTGMLIDKKRLYQMIDIYNNIKSHLLAVLVYEAKKYSIENFNPASSQQVRTLLFERLHLPPIKTTSGERWVNVVGNQAIDDPTAYNASTDQTTLEILESKHPIVKLLLQFRRIDQICKTWLKPPAEGQPLGGLIEKIWPDGRIHSRFSQLTETGRLTSSNPNVQNLPKKAEGYLTEIFKGRNQSPPPPLRTLIVAPPGHVFVESDFVQAELVVLAALSNDQNMIAALTTPGLDLHDLTALTAFRLIMIDKNDNQITNDDLIKLAQTYKDRGGDKSQEFKDFVKTLRYVDSKGKIYTRNEFKETIRVSAKSVNFGIPYGRGAADIARQIKGETGINKSLQELENEIQEIIRIWKTETYPQAWNYMLACAQCVYHPGYIINPWGRVRHFPAGLSPDNRNPELERQAQNFPVQSTVADTTLIALDQIVKYREATGLHFKIVNQIHDAIMIEAPENEIEESIKMFHNTMGNIEIPIENTKIKGLKLDIDVKVMTRWGEEKEE